MRERTYLGGGVAWALVREQKDVVEHAVQRQPARLLRDADAEGAKAGRAHADHGGIGPGIRKA